MNLGRLWRTVRFLKPVQIYGRLFRRFAPGAKQGPAPPLRPLAGSWVAPAARAPSLIGPDRVRFLNEEGDIARADQWNDPARAKLWLYNLHYFDDLAADGAADRAAAQQALIARWIDENPPGFGNGWEPYPVSLRIVNWIKWALAGGAAPAGWADSLAVQTRWLEGRLERWLLGNHLLANAKALVFAGLYFEGAEADRWLATGMEIYRRQLPEQVLTDGGHFERSPMYHALILDDVLDLWNVARAYGRDGEVAFASLPALAERMRGWLATMSHPDGQISFFNDAAFGIAPAPGALEAYALRLGLGPIVAPVQGLIQLRLSGYLRLARGEAVALLDCAPIGPNYLPGHAHADTLSFELSIGGERVIVNGGTSVYGEGPQRLLERATASHSTVEIDGENSSEVWGGFRVGRRARVFDVVTEETDGQLTVSAAHDGYRWRRGRPVHRRAWRLEDRALGVSDIIEGSVDRAVARFHLGQGISATADPRGLSGVLVTPAGRRVNWTSTSPVRIAPSRWRPEFGLRMPTLQFVIELTSSQLEVEFSW
jgi:uncharacterized heparinase superfamily protein